MRIHTRATTSPLFIQDQRQVEKLTAEIVAEFTSMHVQHLFDMFIYYNHSGACVVFRWSLFQVLESAHLVQEL